jgi:hypothetical protein
MHARRLSSRAHFHEYDRAKLGRSIARPKRPAVADSEKPNLPAKDAATPDVKACDTNIELRSDDTDWILRFVIITVGWPEGHGRRSIDTPITENTCAAPGVFSIEMSQPHSFANASQQVLAHEIEVCFSMQIISSTQCVRGAPNKTAIASQHHAGKRAKFRGAVLLPNS